MKTQKFPTIYALLFYWLKKLRFTLIFLIKLLMMRLNKIKASVALARKAFLQLF